MVIGIGVAVWGVWSYFGRNWLIPRELPKQEEVPSPAIEMSEVSVVAEGLDTPWGVAFFPDNSFLVTERPGRVRLVDSSGKLHAEPVAAIVGVREAGEGGLLGIEIHPNFLENHYVYLYYTYREDGGETLNRVVRMTYDEGKLDDEKLIVDEIPGSSNHNGGRIKFGPDGYIYITTGDAGEPSQAQDINTLGGKILRVTDEGEPAPDNPFNNLVYSYGHRNPQGLAWDRWGRLWATEHGRSGVRSGFDELNLIKRGGNYGWPEAQGDDTGEGVIAPILHSGASTTWAPAGMAQINDSLFFGGLRGEALYQAEIGSGEIKLRVHFAGEFGRIREVVVHNGEIYMTTSNKDGRGRVRSMDDKIIRIGM